MTWVYPIWQVVSNKTALPNWKISMQTMVQMIRMPYISKKCYSKTKIKFEIVTTQDRCKTTWVQWRTLGTHNKFLRFLTWFLWYLHILAKTVLLNNQSTNLSSSPNHPMARVRNQMERTDIKTSVEFIISITSSRIRATYLNTCSKTQTCKRFKTTITQLPVLTFKFNNLIKIISIRLDTRVTKVSILRLIIKIRTTGYRETWLWDQERLVVLVRMENKRGYLFQILMCIMGMELKVMKIIWIEIRIEIHSKLSNKMGQEWPRLAIRSIVRNNWQLLKLSRCVLRANLEWMISMDRVLVMIKVMA